MKKFGDLAQIQPWLVPVVAAVKNLSGIHGNDMHRDIWDGYLKHHSQLTLFRMADNGCIIGLMVPKTQVTALADNIMRDIFILLIPSLLLPLALWFIARRLYGRLESTRKALDDIAHGDGDLTRRLNTSGRGEPAEIPQSFNQFVDKIAGVIVKVRSSGLHVAHTPAGWSKVTGS